MDRPQQAAAMTWPPASKQSNDGDRTRWNERQPQPRQTVRHGSSSAIAKSYSKASHILKPAQLRLRSPLARTTQRLNLRS